MAKRQRNSSDFIKVLWYTILYERMKQCFGVQSIYIYVVYEQYTKHILHTIQLEQEVCTDCEIIVGGGRNLGSAAAADHKFRI